MSATKVLYSRIAEDLHAEIAAIAREEDRSAVKQVERLLRAAVEEYRKTNPRKEAA